MRKLAIGFQVALGVLLLGSGVAKLAGLADADRDRLAIAAWFWLAAGVAEVVGALGMLAGLKLYRLAAAAGLWVATLMGGALVAHVRAGDGPAAMLPAALVLASALTVAAVRAGSPHVADRTEPAPLGAGD